MTGLDLAALRSDLMRDEGVRLKPYRCTAGKLTIGVGRNLDDVGVSQAEALDLLDHDIEACLADLRTFQWFTVIDPVRLRVLINMRFNLGHAGFHAFKQMLAAVGRHDYAAAADEMRDSKWATDVPARAGRLMRLMRSGVDA